MVDSQEPIVLPATKPSKRKNAAAELLKKKVVVDAKRKREALDRENEDTVFFLKCPRIAGHAAAFLTEKPTSGRIHPGMWESLHHNAGDAWPYTYIPCQECFAEGESRNWCPHVRAVPRGDGSFDFVFATDRQHVVGSMSRRELGVRRESLTSAVGGGSVPQEAAAIAAEEES